MKTKIIATLIMAISLIVATAGLNKPPKEVERVVIKIVKEPIPMSVKDLQRFLNEQPDPWGRYKCKIDGRFGTETNKALENYLCDQYAKEYLK